MYDRYVDIDRTAEPSQFALPRLVNGPLAAEAGLSFPVFQDDRIPNLRFLFPDRKQGPGDGMLLLLLLLLACLRFLLPLDDAVCCRFCEYAMLCLLLQ